MRAVKGSLGHSLKRNVEGVGRPSPRLMAQGWWAGEEAVHSRSCASRLVGLSKGE